MCNAWDEFEIETLVRLWNQDASIREIAGELDRPTTSVKMYLQRHRKALGLAKRTFRNTQTPNQKTTKFDNEWHGVVPLGHWSITKPWGKSCVVKPATDY